ncbi:hypothetical protein [Salirhabdus sp. Marseille-P4669]|uniref:hypothetical protein n=1 Tax=Salirhabdus sp. Marseille-P4669 TaxID=2042310 RepID=UPI000C79F157|nr:hypothetical protein [Salirhabdus sp. Marseille-P4669]
MSFQPELDALLNKILNQLQNENSKLSAHQQRCIKEVLQESFDAGYEEGLMDGEEIAEKPISG